jgi:hypothetical protein
VQLVFRTGSFLGYHGAMEREVRERFERIESILERVTDRLDRITLSHVELETAQKNTTIALNRFIEESGARIADLTILVDQLINKDPMDGFDS